MTEEKMNNGKKLDKALYYVCENLKKSGHNEKPVLLHSFKVSYKLLECGYDGDVVVSAALHDLIEDTDITYDDILNEYGKKIADIVNAVSFKPDIQDKFLQAKEMFQRCKKCGKDALLVKCADLCDNIDFVSFVSKEDSMKLLKKYTYFLETYEKDLSKEKIYKELLKKYKKIIKD